MKIFLKVRYYKCYNAIELIYATELIFLTLTTAKNVWFAVIVFLIMGLNFKILYAKVVMMLWLNIRDITIITVKNVNYHYIIHNIQSKSEKNSLKIHSFQDNFFSFFCFSICFVFVLVWLIVWTSINL